jgi:peroxiredoxin
VNRARPWIAGALAALLLACGSGSESADGLEPGRNRAPGFALQSLAGDEVRLDALRGKTVIIDFWATWCPPCEFQIPILNEVYATHRDRGVEVLGVSVDTGGIEAVREYIAKHAAQYPILMGTEALAREFGAPGFPTLVIVAPDGTFGGVHVGLIEMPELEKAIADAATRVPRS